MILNSWILIITLFGIGNDSVGAIGMQEFESRGSCYKAASVWKGEVAKSLKKDYVHYSAICIPYGDK